MDTTCPKSQLDFAAERTETQRLMAPRGFFHSSLVPQCPVSQPVNLQLMKVAGTRAFCFTCGFSFCISLQVPQASFSFLFTPLSFRSAKVLKTSQESPGQGSWHEAPYTIRGNFYPSDRATSDHILVRGPPPPARVVVWEEYIYLRVSTGHTQHTGLGAQKLKPPFKVHVHATSAGKPTEGFVCTECPQHSIWDPPRIFTVHELASW